MHVLHTSPETEHPEVLPPTSKVIKTVMAALVAMGIYDAYQECESCMTDNTTPIVELQKH